jgi:hypothetical protein
VEITVMNVMEQAITFVEIVKLNTNVLNVMEKKFARLIQYYMDTVLLINTLEIMGIFILISIMM